MSTYYFNPKHDVGDVGYTFAALRLHVRPRGERKANFLSCDGSFRETAGQILHQTNQITTTDNCTIFIPTKSKSIQTTRILNLILKQSHHFLVIHSCFKMAACIIVSSPSCPAKLPVSFFNLKLQSGRDATQPSYGCNFFCCFFWEGGGLNFIWWVNKQIIFLRKKTNPKTLWTVMTAGLLWGIVNWCNHRNVFGGAVVIAACKRNKINTFAL